jgi:hypothetical protein
MMDAADWMRKNILSGRELPKTVDGMVRLCDDAVAHGVIVFVRPQMLPDRLRLHARFVNPIGIEFEDPDEYRGWLLFAPTDLLPPSFGPLELWRPQ